MEFPQLLRLELHLLPSPADANQQAKKTRPYKNLPIQRTGLFVNWVQAINLNL